MIKTINYLCLFCTLFCSLNAHSPIKDKTYFPFDCLEKGDHGFIGGAAGVKRLEKYAPPRIPSKSKLNHPLGQVKADKIAKKLGLNKNLCFTEEQYLTLISGQGADGSGNPAAAAFIDECVKIFINTCGNPLLRIIDGKITEIILGSYGLTVNEKGLLQSLANPDAPTRKANALIAPGGYLSTWSKANGAEESFLMLYSSAYTLQLPYGIAAQHEGGNAELALYLDCFDSAFTGLGMAPSIWEINFCLIYMLNPDLAAQMPAYWAPIPKKIVKALQRSPTGQVPYAEYASYLKSGKCKN